MILSMSRQTLLFLSTIAAGAVIGLIYDLFRVLRKTIPHANLAVQIEDAVFWLGCSVLMFSFMLHRNYGEVRFFAILGMALGAVIYFHTISKIVMRVLLTLAVLMQRTMIIALRILFTPVRLTVKLLTPPSKWACRKLKRVAQRARSKLRGMLRNARRNMRIMAEKV